MITLDVEGRVIDIRPEKEHKMILGLLDEFDIQYNFSGKSIRVSDKYLLSLNKALIPVKKLLVPTPRFKIWIAEEKEIIKKNNGGSIPCKFCVGVVWTKVLKGTDKIPHEQLFDACKFFAKSAINTNAYKEGQWDGFISLYNKSNKKFPSGLISKVTKILDDNNIPYVIEYTYDRFPEKQFEYDIVDGMIPDDDQIQAIDAALKFGRGIVKAPTAFGKTAILAKRIVAGFGVPTLFVANKKILIEDAYKEFATSLILPSGECAKVARIKAETFGDTILPSDDIKPLDANIIVATIQSLDARLKDPRTKSALSHWLQNICKCIIIDESQAVGTDTWDFVTNNCYAPYRILLSATPRRTDGATIKLEGTGGPIIFTTSAEDQIKRGRLCDLDIHYKVYDHKLYNESDKGLDYIECYKEFIMNNEVRNHKCIIEPALKMLADERIILILVAFIEHGHIIKQMLLDSGINEDEVDFIWGGTTEKKRDAAIEDFRGGKIKVMIGSTIFDAGANIPVISGVILGGAGNSDITLIQRIGRGARICNYEEVLGYAPKFLKDNDGVKKSLILDILDKNVKFFGRQSRNRYKNAIEEFGKIKVSVEGGNAALRNTAKYRNERSNAIQKDLAASEAKLNMFKAFIDKK